jgi:glycine betaine/choline ABC-type transport system substrate-binding protein
MKSRATIHIEKGDKVFSVGGSDFTEPFIIVTNNWENTNTAIISIDGADEYQMRRLSDLIDTIRAEIVAGNSPQLKAAE